jgi:hypothetical protein
MIPGMGMLADQPLSVEKQKTQPLSSVPPFARPLTDDKLRKRVKEAEKGPFYTSDEVKEIFKTWKRKRA